MTVSIYSDIVKNRQKKKASYKDLWPDQYINRETKTYYSPHNEDEQFFVESREPLRMLLKGGEGAGKSVAGIVKTLNNLRDGLSGIMGSPTLPHLKRSLWKEFCRWCPPHVVIERHRHRLNPDWAPGGAFEMVFYNKYGGYSTLECGGFIENQMGSWEGPTVNFVYGDEMRHHKTAIALKTFDGRVRRTGPNQEPPQLYYTTTPRKHWLWEYFGPLQRKDKFADFKKDMFCGTVPVELNKDNLAEGYIEKRRQSLTAAEARVLMDAEWEDVSDVLQFIEPVWWDLCGSNNIPPYSGEAAIIAIDASKGRETSIPDCAALILITRHPSEPDILLIRHVKIWDVLMGTEFDFELLTEEVVKLMEQFTVIEIAYDPYQLTYWAQTMRRKHPALYKEFTQSSLRLLADSSLQSRIMHRTIWHPNDVVLTDHIKNANCKKEAESKQDDGIYTIRIVKRHSGVKIDGAVATSMAAYRADWYNPV